MSSRNSIASLPMACLLAVGFLGTVPVVNATSAGLSVPKPNASASNLVIEAKHRRGGRRLYLPIGPSYLAYDYPYYYARGFYPKHIGAGYVYYGYPYAYYAKRYRSRCSYLRRRCVANARHKRGSARHQRRACRCR